MKLTIDELQFLVEALDAVKHEREDKTLRAKLMAERHRLVGLKEACEAHHLQSTYTISQRDLKLLVDDVRKNNPW